MRILNLQKAERGHAPSSARPWKRQVNAMEDGKKKIWMCLLVIVLAALAIGALYYFTVPEVPYSEAFLVCSPPNTGSMEGARHEV